MKKYLIAMLLGLLCLTGCGDAADPTLPNNYTSLTSIEITLANPQIANLTSSQFTAIGNFSGLFTRDITAAVAWESLDTTVATLSNAVESIGRVSGLSPGTAEIRASLEGVEGSFTLTVSTASIDSLTISPLTPSTPKGLTRQFQAVGTFSDATTQDLSHDVSWHSADSAVASVSNSVGSKGLATGEGIGSSIITATFEGATDSTLMTVTAAIFNSLNLTPLTPSILSLSSGQLTATGTFSDASTLDVTDQVSWTSLNLSIASISNATGTQGLVSALSAGVTTIEASLDGHSASTLLSVTGGDLSTLNVLPGNSTQVHISPVIPIQMTADGVFPSGPRDISALVTWSSTEPTVATIDSQGEVTTVAAGDTIIKAVYGETEGSTSLSVIEATYVAGSLTLTPATADLTVLSQGTSRRFSAEGEFSDGSTRDLTSEVTWSSSAPTVVKANNTRPTQGVVTGVAPGSATISADFRGLDSAAADLSVTAPNLLSLSIDDSITSRRPGESLQLKVTATYDSDPLTLDITEDVDWTSADTSVAIFHDALNARGEVIGVDSGSVDLTASFGGQTATLTLVVQ